MDYIKVANGKVYQDAPEESILGRYTNHFRVGINAIEFVVDFGQFYGEQSDPLYHTRIITSPRYVKELLNILMESISDYEKSFGQIGEASQG